MSMLLWSLAACITLDSLILPSKPVEAYDLSSDVIPAELIEEVSFPSVDGVVLSGVWFRQPESKPPLIWTHGNGGALDAELDRIETYWLWGDHDVFAWDFRGFGTSEPTMDAEGVLEHDGLAAVQYVSDLTGVPPEEIPWISLSLGAAIMAHTNDEIAAKAVVLENMFPSSEMLVDGATGLDLPAGWFFEDVYDNLTAVQALQSPVLIIHGLADDYIDPAFGPVVYDHAPDNPRWLWQPEGVAHSNIHRVIPDRYEAVVRAFLSQPEADPVPTR